MSFLHESKIFFEVIFPYHPMEKWYIYLHEWLIFMVNVGI